MRHRVRVSSTEELATVSWSPNGTPGYSGHGSVVVTRPKTTSLEVIDDVIRKGRTSLGLIPPSRVFHRTVRWEKGIQYPLVNWEDWHHVEVSNAWFPFPFEQVLELMYPVPGSVAYGLGLDAWNAFYTQVPSDLDGLNFLWELREIGDLIPKVVNRWSRTLAGGYLNWKFGYEPLFADLGSIFDITRSVFNRLDYLKKTRGKWTKTRFRRSNVWLPPNLNNEEEWIFPSGTGQRYKLQISSFRSDFTAGGYFRHYLEGLDDAWGTFRAFAAKLGLNNPIGSAWESIPASFLLDWLLPLGKAAEALAFQPFAGVWEVRDLTHSFKEECRIVTTQAFYPEYGNSPSPLGTLVLRKYFRDVGLPLDPTLLGVSDPATSASKLALLIALMWARWR